MGLFKHIILWPIHRIAESGMNWNLHELEFNIHCHSRKIEGVLEVHQMKVAATHL